MKAYLAYLQMSVRLTFRDRTVIFFNLLFPLIFFFMFAQLFHAEQGGVIAQVDASVLSIGILGSGFFGAGMRAVMDREQNILRRFKVAPITAGPIVVSSMVNGLLNYLPVTIVVFALSHFMYGMPVPERWLSILIFISLGVLAFRALGTIIAAVVNSQQESQIIIQLLYFPMLLLSGAAIPMTVFPTWVQLAAQFLPSTHLFAGMQAIIGGRESLLQNSTSVIALLLTTLLGGFIAVKLFRWEKEEKIRNSGKLWVLAVLAPFVLMGIYQSYTRDNVGRAKILERDMRRSRSWLLRGARIFVGDGTVIETGAVLIKNGKIAEIFTGDVPDPKSLKAELVEASGKTLMPGLIDAHIHLGAPGGVFKSQGDYVPAKYVPRELAAYLYSGVTSVKSAGDSLELMLTERAKVKSGEWLGADLFIVGPMFTTEGGHGTEYFKNMPKQAREMAEKQTIRLPKTPAEAGQQVDDLAQKGVDGIKAILEAGQPGILFNRLDTGILNAIGAEAAARKLPLMVHTGDARDVVDALAAGASSIEHGSFRDEIPESVFAAMKAKNASYDPTLTVVEALLAMANGKTDPLDGSLTQQVAPPGLLQSTKAAFQGPEAAKSRERLQALVPNIEIGQRNLVRAWKAGVMLVTGSDSGNMMVIHGPAIHRELQLWVKAGIPPQVALQAATYNAARALKAGDHIGLIRKGYDANLLLVDGNPLQDISATERISFVMFHGEHISRADLFDQD